jgi:hypothetical protein
MRVTVFGPQREASRERLRAWWVLSSGGQLTYVYDGEYEIDHLGTMREYGRECGRPALEVVGFAFVELTKQNNPFAYVSASLDVNNCVDCATPNPERTPAFVALCGSRMYLPYVGKLPPQGELP